MKILRRIIEYLKKVFNKKQPKTLDKANNQVEHEKNKEQELFFAQLKVEINKSVKVETESCVQNGLGFEGKIKG